MNRINKNNANLEDQSINNFINMEKQFFYKRIVLVIMITLIGQMAMSQINVSTTDKNWISVNSYDAEGNLVGANVSFSNGLGKTIQTISYDKKLDEMWASEVFYDNQGRPALQTLSSPIGRQSSFSYMQNFTRKPNGLQLTVNDYDSGDIETPPLIGNQANSLGWYYSESNTREPYQDVTDRPYSRSIYSVLNPGTTLKTIGGNKQNGEWRHSYSFTMPVGQELSNIFAFEESKYANIKAYKTVVRDVHGVENVVFTDTDGNTLATARSGDEDRITSEYEIFTSTIRINEQGYIDIHIPVGITGIEITNPFQVGIKIYDLITEQLVTTSHTALTNGFYRVALSDYTGRTSGIQITYRTNYYDYNLNKYDKSGRLISNAQPVDHVFNPSTIYEYNSLNQLVKTQNRDEGTSRFKYRKDGQIRFSQNHLQRDIFETGIRDGDDPGNGGGGGILIEEFSYTNYDTYGRPVESGLSTNNTPSEVIIFDDLDPDEEEFPGFKKEQVFTVYDIADQNGLQAAFTRDSRYINYGKQSFVSGNVSKTYTANPETTTTWYSYDIYGRVKWIVQKINGLNGVKTIDYEYDPITSQVTKVYFQKGVQNEQFIHRYTYDPADYSLIKVETSLDNINFQEDGQYEYYETGSLKRTIIGNGLQGIDYVYNLNGALKSVNDPRLNSSTDPGRDVRDLFGMNLHYYQNDYRRTNTPTSIPSMAGGADQYNGNIKAWSWNTKDENNGVSDTYYYSYNKNNWLTGASFNNALVGNNGIEVDKILSTPIVSSQNARASRSISLKPGFHVEASSSLIFTAKIVEEQEVDSTGDYNVYGVTYDANGNIQSLNRNKHTEDGANTMDQLSYVYKNDKKNQLLRVDDAVTRDTNAADIKDQDGDNYIYNSIGQLVRNNEEGIDYFYNTSGLVSEIKRNNVSLVKFFYNDKGHRVRKEAYSTEGNLNYTEHYVRDAAGTAMAIYRDGQAIEHTIYGSGRLGVYKRVTGNSLYQLTDHLGNVRVVVGRTSTGQPIAITTTDYYPFGMAMPGRTLSGAEGYRYAYQGQEKDPETGKEAFELRLWDSRIGRWLTTDPAGQYDSPYMAMGNNPIIRIDPDGGFDWVYNKETDRYIWDENVTSASDSDLNTDLYEYVGTSFNSVSEHFEKNASFLDKFKSFVGSGGVSTKIDFSSYVSAMIRPKIENAILSQKDGYAQFLDGKRSTVGFYPKDFSIPGLERNNGTFLTYDTGLGSNEYHFSTTLNIDGSSIPITGTYLVRNKGVNIVSSINDLGKYATSHGEYYENALSFDGKAKGVVILNVDNRQLYDQLLLFMFGTHK
ncbi:RHS repeat domain-containing protein [Aquimarina rhabdastrellae]